eukprot:RCo005072
MLLKGCQLARGKGEPAEKLLKRATHLALQGKGIERISNLHLCSQLRVLYLYDNRIRSLEGLGGVSAQLTHLYLQNNDIGGLNGLPELPCLRKLYLDGNSVAVVGPSAMAGLPALQELYMANQKLPDGVGLRLDSEAFVGLSQLTVLNLAGNGLREGVADALAPVGGSLTNLDLSHNAIPTLRAVQPLLLQCPRVSILGLAGNPFTRTTTGASTRYLEELLGMATGRSALATVDGRTLPSSQREFLRQLS